MRYIGNYKKWIDPNWRQLVLDTVGQARPKDWPPADAVESAEYKKYEEAGYDLNSINWWVYEATDLRIEINPPWCSGDVHWWITKLMPGQYMPMHSDPHTHYEDCQRYWIPLQDFEPGHIFIYNNTFINNYNVGDVYEYYNSTDLHGASNIGHTPRIILQVTEYL
jgi:hypothetical protein